MFEQINEPIEVIAEFRGGKLFPLKFIWPARYASQLAGVAGGHNREIIVKKVNLAYSNREGRGKFYYFAVSDGTNYFKLQFNAENLNWTLLETYAD